MSTQLGLFSKIVEGKKLQEEDYINFAQMLYTFPLFVRERGILTGRFNRMLHAVDRFEKGLKKLDFSAAFGDFFNKDLWGIETKFQL